MEVESITFEHHQKEENLGIGESNPRISWKVVGDSPNWVQTSYEIRILRGGAPSSWDNAEYYKFESSDSVLVPWPSTPLQSREEARVQVRATGAKSATTNWSRVARIEAGLLKREDWTAQMIATEQVVTSAGNLRPTYFRKSFELADDIAQAKLYITCHGLYEAFINGAKVGDHVMAPGWTSYKHHLSYQTYDVSELLKRGTNVIGVEVGEGWYCGRIGWDGNNRYVYADRLAVLAQLEVTLKDEKKATIVSDETWKTSGGPTVSSEIYDGEEYDAALEIPGWSTASVDADKWSSVTKIDFPTAKLQAAEGPPVRVTEIVKIQEIIRSPSGKVILDFGQNLVGRLRVRASGPKGQKIVFTHTEVLEKGEIGTRPLRNCKQKDALTLGSKTIAWEPKFTFHGFRYVQVENWPSNHGEPLLSDIEAVVIHTDMKQTGWFKCSEPMVNKLHENIRWGMRGNFVSIPTDCPQRDERLGWTGDIQVFSPTASFLYNTSGMLSGWLKDLAVEQIKDFNGVVPLVVPVIKPGELAFPRAAWSDAAIIVPWDLYQAFGDSQILLDQYESMKQWLEKGLDRQPNGLWKSVFQYGDWLDPDAPPDAPDRGKTDAQFVANAYLAHITYLISRVAGVLDLTGDAKYWASEAERIKKLFQDEYLSSKKPQGSDSMTAMSLALAYNLLPAGQVSSATKHLEQVVHSSKFKISTGFVGTPLILPVLTDAGKTQLAYRMLLEKECPSWFYPITMGATTMWERWDSMLPDGSINPGSMTSFNHYALGSVGAWLHATVGGISPATPGWKVVRFEPVPGGTIDWAKARFEGPYGEVKCEWEVKGKTFVVKVTVPPNSTGLIKLPGAKKVIGVGSGTHEYAVEYTPEPWPPKAI
ncbi:glycoside hydrolase family 78 protein [Hyaloscypha variabilis F]|uniref:alpha-L-rhamnosidase n=1 Tax=Hyaloscypha variabilis (strain UAMH 11265 / GT02V1 / F) TaxID=1149755 RepID=A0A2J6QYU5_HYAVF|nr:glycoside hydrolase family 78 protein [Hyaloscypha variabilis F]